MTVENRKLTMEDIMVAQVCDGVYESIEPVEIKFSKITNVKPYESETVEVRMHYALNPNYTGIERMLAMSILQAQCEYEVYCNLVFKGLITAEEMVARKEQLVTLVNSYRDKAEAVLERDVNHIVGKFEPPAPPATPEVEVNENEKEKLNNGEAVNEPVEEEITDKQDAENEETEGDEKEDNKPEDNKDKQ